MESIKYIGPMDCGEDGKVYLFNVLSTGSTIAVKKFSDISRKLKEHNETWDKGNEQLPSTLVVNNKIIATIEEHEGLKTKETIAGNKLKKEFHQGTIYGLGLAFNMIRRSMQQDDSMKMPIRAL